MNITLTNIVKGVLDNSKHKYRITQTSPKCTKFVVECGSVKLQGKVTDSIYEVKTKKADGTILDEISCSVSKTDDVINRINESVTTACKLSKYVKACNEAKKDYLQPYYVTEDEEEDTKNDKEILLDDEDTVDNDTETVDTSDVEPEGSLEQYLDGMFAALITLGDEVVDKYTLAASEQDADTKDTIIGFAGSLYSLADDVNDLIEDLFPEEEVEESVKRSVKPSNTKKAINKLSEASLLLRGNKSNQEIREAIKLIKSQLIIK